MDSLVVNFTLLMAATLDAGWPLLKALRVISNLTEGAFKNALKEVIDSIESGSTFSEALARQPEVFNRFYVNMVKAGESGGALEIIFQRLGEFFELEPLKNELARGMRLLGTMVSAGVPILETIDTTVAYCQQEDYKKVFTLAAQTIREGDFLFQAFEQSGRVSSEVVLLIRKGEKTGDIDSALMKAAEMVEKASPQ